MLWMNNLHFREEKEQHLQRIRVRTAYLLEIIQITGSGIYLTVVRK